MFLLLGDKALKRVDVVLIDSRSPRRGQEMFTCARLAELAGGERRAESGGQPSRRSDRDDRDGPVLPGPVHESSAPFGGRHRDDLADGHALGPTHAPRRRSDKSRPDPI